MEPWGIDTISLPMPHTVKAFAKARPINFPVSHPLARQKYLLHQNKNTIQFLCALIFEALGFKRF